MAAIVDSCQTFIRASNGSFWDARYSSSSFSSSRNVSYCHGSNMHRCWLDLCATASSTHVIFHCFTGIDSDGLRTLRGGTLCPSAKHHLSSHYNIHSLYGHMEAIVTRKYVAMYFKFMYYRTTLYITRPFIYAKFFLKAMMIICIDIMMIC